MKWWPPKKSNTTQSKSPEIAEILIAETARRSEDPADIVAFNVDFVNSMLTQGAYLQGELPENAMRSYYVDYYLAQVANGGHGQFLGNSNWNDTLLQFVSDGLRAMEAGPYIGIFAELCRFLEEEPDRAAAVAQAGGFDETPDPVIAELDKRFLDQGPYEIITPANADWLRSLPELRAVPDGEYRDVIARLHQANPQRAARLAVRRREAIESSLRDEVRVASRLLCVEAEIPPVINVGSAKPDTTAPDGRKGVGWAVESKAGRHVVIVMDDFAYLCETYLGDGRKVTDEMMHQQQLAMLNGEQVDFEAFATMTEREVARIPASKIADAIMAAEKIPVVKIAELLSSKVAIDERLADVFAIGTDPSGHWIWMMETNKRIGILGATEKGFVFRDMKKKSLAVLSKRELRKAIEAEPVGHA